MPRVLTAVATLSSGIGTYLPRCVRNSSRSAISSRLDLLFEAFGHQRLGRGLQILDVLAEDDVPLGFGVDDLDRGLRFGSKRPLSVWPSAVRTV